MTRPSGLDRNRASENSRPRARTKIGVLLGTLAAAIALSASGCRDGYNTALKQKSQQLHSGMSVREVTNRLAGFEILRLTDYETPDQKSWVPQAKHDCVSKLFASNSTAKRITFISPSHGWMAWRDTCEVDFDTNGVIVGYTWTYPH